MHIGYEKANHTKILQFFNRAILNSDLVILNGDTFDLWRTPYHRILFNIRPQFRDVMDAIRRTADKVPVAIIPGNHDFNLKKVWGDHKEYNIHIVNRSLQRDSFYFTHGWQFDIQQRFGSIAYRWLVYRFPHIYQRYFKGPPQIMNRRSNTRTKQVKNIHAQANKYALIHHKQYIIIGHTHVPGIYNNVVDCGDFIDSCSYVEINNTKPEIKYI